MAIIKTLSSKAFWLGMATPFLGGSVIYSKTGQEELKTGNYFSELGKHLRQEIESGKYESYRKDKPVEKAEREASYHNHSHS